MTHQEIIKKTVNFTKSELKNAEGGHDWFHIERVWNTSKLITSTEPHANLLIVELAALLHDIADSKFHNGDEEIGPRKTKNFLESLKIPTEIIIHVVKIIENISFKGGHTIKTFKSLELDIVTDADRLDALGAIGIARAFNYGGFKIRPLFDPNQVSNLNMSKEEYKKSNSPTINHFYEKLLLLFDNFKTLKGKELAQSRHIFLKTFLLQFFNEWYDYNLNLLPSSFDISE